MFTKIYKVLYEQLEKNLAEQDFDQPVCTQVRIRDKVILELHHPSRIIDRHAGVELVFPEREQNDIDKEFESLIALSLSFSIKKDRELLEKFKSRHDFGNFKEIKTLGIRMYAMDFGVDIQKAVDKSIEILNDIYKISEYKRINVITFNPESVKPFLIKKQVKQNTNKGN